MIMCLRRKFVPVFLFIAGFLASTRGYCTEPEPAIRFIENKDQWPANVHFAARLPGGGNMIIGPGFFRYHFTDGDRIRELHELRHHRELPDAGTDWQVKEHAVQVTFIGASANVQPLPFGRSSDYFNYFLGNDPEKWTSMAYAYSGMLYPSLYRDTDLKVYASGSNLKYDFIIAPGGDPTQIALRYEGADDIRILQGDLAIKTSLAEIIEKRPVAWQYVDGEKRYVRCEFHLEGNLLSFCFPEGYDPCAGLVIDPLLIFSTYSGFTADNWGSTATPGERGNLYSAGVTNQNTFGGGVFTTTVGAFQRTYGGDYDIGILKYDSTGARLLYSTFLGGANAESPHSLVMNGNEELIVLGTTSSPDFPTTPGAFDRSYGGGTNTLNVIRYINGSDIFVARISRDGTLLMNSTFLGGSENDGLNNGELVRNYGDELRGDVITDAAGNIYISSVTASDDFFPPAFTNGLDVAYNDGLTDALLLKLSPDLSQVLWGTYLGGGLEDAAYTLKFDSQGNIFIAGGTASPDFPVVGGGFQPTRLGGVDGWILKLAANGSAILNSTFISTFFYEQVYFIDLNEADEVYVYGQTNAGNNFSVTPANVYRNARSGQFVQKYNHALSTRIFSTVFGSGGTIPDISPTAFLVNECNNLYMAGWGGMVNSENDFWDSSTHGMPVTSDAIQKTTSGSDFYFIVLTDDATRLLYATYLGGSQSRTHVDGGTSRFDKGGIVYHAVCSGCDAYNATQNPTSDFPTTPGAWSRVNRSGNCNNAAFKFDLSSLKARIQTNSVQLNRPGLNKICLGDRIVFQNLSTGGETFEWDLGDGTKPVKTDTTAITHLYLSTGQYLVKLKAIDPGTCKVVDSTSTMVTVNTIYATVQENDRICEGESYQLKSSGGALYAWRTRDRTLVSTQSSPVVSPADTTVYFVRVTARNGCFYDDSVKIDVVPAVNASFEFARQSDCFDRPFVRFTNLTDSLRSDDTMFFDFGDGHTSDVPQSDHHYEKDGVYRVRLVAARHGCVYEKTADIPVFTIKVPNVITPGGSEGLNDVFTVQYGAVEGVTPADFGFKTSLTVYNRWGTVLYKSDDYQYDWSGEGLAAGVYYYELSVQDHAACKSWLQLVK